MPSRFIDCRAVLAPLLNTRTEDGELHERQRAALDLHIGDTLRLMGGVEQAYRIAAAARAAALIELLDCIASSQTTIRP